MENVKRYRPISYLKSNADELAKELSEETGAVVITENGVPSFVCLSYDEYFRMQETNALVRLVDLGERDVAQGQYKTLSDARKILDERLAKARAAKGDNE